MDALRKTAAGVVLGATSALFSVSLAAAEVVSVFFDDTFTALSNDCAGYFGENFAVCNIWVIENEETFKLSPVIAKFPYDGDSFITTVGPDGAEINTDVFPSIDGSEFTLNVDGSWVYAPTGDDPSLLYWVEKAANDFTLYWTVPEAAITDGICNSGTDDENYDYDCLLAAIPTTAGLLELQALSHVTFYDSGGGGGEEEVPSPAPLALFAIGALAAGVGLRRRKG